MSLLQLLNEIFFSLQLDREDASFNVFVTPLDLMFCDFRDVLVDREFYTDELKLVVRYTACTVLVSSEIFYMVNNFHIEISLLYLVKQTESRRNCPFDFFR